MDFPATLNNGYFVSSMDELKQTLTLLFQNDLGTFMQSMEIGSYVGVHREEAGIKLAVKRTVEEIPNLVLDYCEVNLPKVNIGVSYQDEIVNFSFTLKTYENIL